MQDQIWTASLLKRCVLSDCHKVAHILMTAERSLEAQGLAPNVRGKANF